MKMWIANNMTADSKENVRFNQIQFVAISLKIFFNQIETSWKSWNKIDRKILKPNQMNLKNQKLRKLWIKLKRSWKQIKLWNLNISHNFCSQFQNRASYKCVMSIKGVTASKRPQKLRKQTILCAKWAELVERYSIWAYLCLCHDYIVRLLNIVDLSKWVNFLILNYCLFLLCFLRLQILHREN